MSPGRDELQILIVGRTIEGLALAGFLRQADLDPIILDTPQRQPRSPICTLPPGTLKLFERIGVADHLRECGCPICRWTIQRPSGDHTHHVPPGDPAPVTFPRAVIRERLQRTIPNASIREGSRIDSLWTNDGYARIGLADGIEESFDLIVGADGPCSVVRAELTDASVNQREENCLSVAATTQRSEAGITEFHQPDSLVIHVNTGERTRIQACSPHIKDTGLESTADSLPSWLLPDRFNPITLHSHDRIQSAYYAGQTWTAGRGVLLGPAAVAVPPLAGIGLPLAIGDAKAFARTLVAESGSIDAKLEAYARERQGVRSAIADQVHGPSGTDHRPHGQSMPRDLVGYRKLFRTACLDPPGVLTA